MWRPLLLSGALPVLLVLGACVPRTLVSRQADGPTREARAFLEAWAKGDVEGQAALLAPGGGTDVAAEQERWRRALGVEASRFEVLETKPSPREDAAHVTFRAVHRLRGLGEWEVRSTLPFVRVEGRWRLLWTPAVLHPDAQPGDGFARTRTWAPRAPLLDAEGAPLTLPGEVIRIGLEPRKVADREAVLAALQGQLGVDPARVRAALEAPGLQPTAFLPVIDVRPERYQRVRGALAPLPGVFFRRVPARLSPAEGWAAHTLGRVGEATAELLQALGAPYLPGDVVGLSGLERALERTLAGSPSGEVRLVRQGEGPRVLHRFEGQEGVAVRTTLRRSAQAAAEAALEGVAQPAALVAVDVQTGDVVAVASRPLGEGLNRALQGRYPPGSTFKVVTAEALLAAGLTPASPAACPAEVVAGGKRFKNFEGEVLGSSTLRQAFAHSCNTSFVLLAQGLPEGALAAAAARFGFGADVLLGLPAPTADFPPPQDAAELAAAAIGQGRVLATPLHMASVAAAAASGAWRPPHLMAGAATPPESTRPLTAGAEGGLRALMRAVVTEGSGRSAAADVPGLMGKTGTAEFGKAQPPQTHAWFVGVHGGLAFAVLVEGGGVGGRVAVPLAARFARALSTGNPPDARERGTGGAGDPGR